jgi:hypothetical protein
MLLRIEVAAFHPAMLPPVAGRQITEIAATVRANTPYTAVSSLWPYSSISRSGLLRYAVGRPLAVILLCGVRTFLASTCVPPRLPDLLCIHSVVHLSSRKAPRALNHSYLVRVTCKPRLPAKIASEKTLFLREDPWPTPLLFPFRTFN